MHSWQRLTSHVGVPNERIIHGIGSTLDLWNSLRRNRKLIRKADHGHETLGL